MWGGTPAEFYALYNATASALKAYDPNVLVGGPGVARASSQDYSYGLADFVARTGAPMDFFSWHFYGTGAARGNGVSDVASGVRSYLDSVGLARVAQHATEWNTDATPSKTDRDSPAAASFVATVQTLLVQGAVSVSLFYPACAGIGGSSWGMFEDVGDGRTVTTRPETVAYGWLGELLAANPFPRTVVGDPGTQASVIAGAAGTAGGGAAGGNVSFVFATQYWRADRLALSVSGLPTTGPAWRAHAELIDDSHGGGTDLVSSAVGGDGGSATASISIPFIPPAVVRVRLVPPLPS